MTPHRSPVIVEFVGLPGAGKTTVFHQVVSLLRDEGICFVARDEILQQWQKTHWFQKLLNLFPETWNHWQILLQSLALASHVKPFNKQSFVKAGKIFSNVKRIDAIVCHQNYPLILLDQGLLQEAWSVGITGSPPAPEQIKQGLAPLFHNRSIAIVRFNTDIETALDRIQTRSTERSRFDQMSSEAAQLLLSQYTPYLQDIISCAQAFSVPILDINSAGSIKDNAEKVANWMTNLAVH